MNSYDVGRRLALVIGGLAIAGLAATAGCSNDKQSRTPESGIEKAAPQTTMTPGGPNSFSPTILAPPAPTALPGNVVTG